MKDWVRLAFGDSPCAEVPYDGGEIAAAVKPFLSGGKYTAVLYSDTPLFQRKSLLEIVRYAEDNRLNVCRLTRGWLFRTEHLIGAANIVAGKTYYFDEEDFLTASDFKQLAFITDVLRQRIVRFHMDNGVHILDPSSAFIDGDVKIGRNVTVYNNNVITGASVIEDGAVLRPFNFVDNSRIGAGAEITSSNLNSCAIGAGTHVGPYAYIRPHSRIGADCRIGDFVEIKNAVIGDGTKAAHLSYVGDADVGARCNIGCGTVFVNYDGKNKFRSRVGDGVFIGSNANLVAPVTLGDGCFIAAGSTVTEDVPARALTIARARQVNKPDRMGKKDIEGDTKL
jgi:bifunctional UDP-N-acetylglucosamine pyrophosphorylase/glucosamine-1-phosphate N-acetyltransferase